MQYPQASSILQSFIAMGFISKITMNILVVLAHDKPTSLTHYLANQIIKHIDSNKHSIDILDLYHYASDIPFYIHDKATLESNSFFQLSKEKIMNADRLIIVFPMYWYSTPGILKCWLDLITRYAWKFDKPTQAKALHNIKKAFILNSSIQPKWYSFIFGNLALKQVYRTLKWMDVPEVMTYEVGQVNDLNEKKLDRHMKKIINQVYSLLV